MIGLDASPYRSDDFKHIYVIVMETINDLHIKTVIPAMQTIDSRYKDLFTFVEEGEYTFMKRGDKFCLIQSDFWKNAERKNEEYYGISFPENMGKSYGKYLSRYLKRLFPNDTISTFKFKVVFSGNVPSIVRMHM